MHAQFAFISQQVRWSHFDHTEYACAAACQEEGLGRSRRRRRIGRPPMPPSSAASTKRRTTHMAAYGDILNPPLSIVLMSNVIDDRGVCVTRSAIGAAPLEASTHAAAASPSAAPFDTPPS
jgi:hypothetical protein